MAENSKIEWTDHTFNPWIGCTKVSQGCKHCYAENLMDKRYGRVEWGAQGARIRTSADNWKKPLRWNRQAEKEGRRMRVFCASLADVFEDKPDQAEEMKQWRSDLLGLIEDTPNLDWLLLTKRPENVRRLIDESITWLSYPDSDTWLNENQNVWIGTSVEDQEQADKRIPELLRIPAKVRFLSMEPLLGAVDISQMIGNSLNNGLMLRPPQTEWPLIMNSDGDVLGKRWHNGIDWVIVGGESGNRARPMHPDWVRSIKNQCEEAGVPFLFKQWGAWSLINKSEPIIYEGHVVGYQDPRKCSAYGCLSPGGDWFPDTTGWNGRAIDRDTREAYMIKVGKKKAGRVLDGRTWDEFPQTNLGIEVNG